MRSSATRLAYLVSQIPALSHTFILREINELRSRGFEIQVASVNSPDRPLEQLTASERAQAESTFYVKPAGVRGALAAHALTALTQPLAWVRGFAAALRMGGFDLQRSARHFFYFTEALMVARWMRKSDCRHLHVHFASAASTVALIVHRAFGTPFSITVHGPDEFYEVSSHHITQKVAAASFVLCIGHYCRSQLLLHSAPADWDKIEVARLGVDPACFTPIPRPSRKRFEILCIGRLVAAKGQHVLVDAVSHLARGGRDVMLRLVGVGPERDSLARRITALGLEEHVRLEGGIDQDRIREFYQDADCFVLASFAEGIPVVLMEAMAMGVPCVATRITGIPELISDGVDGLLVPAADSRALAEAIEQLIDNDLLRRRLSANARATVVAHYNLQVNSATLAKIMSRRLLPAPLGVAA